MKPITMTYLAKLRALSFSFLCLVLLTACNQDNTTDIGSKSITLSSANVKSVVATLGKDYDENLNSLLANFELAQTHKNEHHFIEYRNREWSPKYIEKKNYYSEIYTNNAAFIEKNQLIPVFHHFENLIFVGLHLKHGLMNKDDALIEKTLGEAKAEQNEVHTIVKSYQ
jgi:hypothetical protein